MSDSRMMKEIVDFINSQPRNKIIIYTDDLDELEPIDVGKCISAEIYTMLDDKRLSLKAKMKIEEFFSNNMVNHSLYGQSLTISNLGILLESDLKIDIVKLFDNFSINNLLFIKWDGEIEENNLYFLSKQDGIKISIKNLSHIII